MQARGALQKGDPVAVGQVEGCGDERDLLPTAGQPLELDMSGSRRVGGEHPIVRGEPAIQGRGGGLQILRGGVDDQQHRHTSIAAAALFVLIGADPRTGWLADVLRVDDLGFILTGRDIPADAWPLTRAPFPLGTSQSGVPATDDVRFGSVKRVASAVGEGSVAVSSLHQYLAALPVWESLPANVASAHS